jgi:birA, biotin-[acetyl-CoA-carboxylase] ligase region
MSVKDDILKKLESGRGQFFSGQELAAMLGVSRNAVWKAVRQLESEGCKIEAVTGKGYCLMADSDVITKQGIEKYLGRQAERFDIRVYRTITSTNTVLKELAANGAMEGTVLISAEQTAGKGRMNRRFHSPSGTGLYLSVLLRPSMKAEDALFITTAAAVAVARTAEEVSGRQTGIKWVNDVYLDGKKICGILTEASLDIESGGLEYAVCGIGVNIAMPEEGFPDEIKNIAGALFDAPPAGDIRNRMAAGILMKLMAYYDDLGNRLFFEEYVKRSIIIGKEITVSGRGEARTATALSIDQSCNLVVRYQDGTVESLGSGEVSVRL